jgi:squalene synthase HpnC
MGVDHYENFPVASRLAPAHLRPAIVAIYRFARTADDVADEGDAPPPQRQTDLARMAQAVRELFAAPAQTTAPPTDTLLRAVAGLQQHIAPHTLRPEPLLDLLSAFSQDVEKTRYADMSEVLDYCSRSANPVGRLMLRLYDCDHDAAALAQADAICTGLQLVNFWQDVAIDLAKPRIYIPRAQMTQFGVDEAQLVADPAGLMQTDAWRALMRVLVDDARARLQFGYGLPARIGGRGGLELRAVIEGGLRIAARLDAVAYDVCRARPKLGSIDWLVIAWRTLVQPARAPQGIEQRLLGPISLGTSVTPR